MMRHLVGEDINKRPKDAKGRSLSLPSLDGAERETVRRALEERGFSEDDLSAGEIDFSHMSIDGIDCSKFIFPFRTMFNRTVFSGRADFTETTFSEWIKFKGATFSELANFKGAAFIEGAIFNGATFSAGVNFHLSTFRKGAAFKSAFFKWGDFTQAEIFEVGNFEGATFSQEADFSGATFSKRADFNGAAFSSLANFNGSTFKDSLKFKAASFETNPPTFYNAKISEAISWTDARFPSTKGLSEDTADIHKDAYERLALMMDRLKKHHDQHRFFRLEMKARRAMERNPLLKFPNWLYQVMADYGYGFGRALTIWLANIGIGAALLFPYHDAALAAPSLTNIGTAIKLWGTAVVTSFSNAHGFLGLNRTTLKQTVAHYQQADLLLPYNVTATAQAVFGVIALFFLILTARNRFRMG